MSPARAGPLGDSAVARSTGLSFVPSPSGLASGAAYQTRMPLAVSAAAGSTPPLAFAFFIAEA